MKRSIVLLGVCLPMLLAMQPATKPAKDVAKPHPAAEGYRAYVAAVHAGDLAKTLAAVEAVPAACESALKAAAKSVIALEAVKTEMIKRLGPPKTDEEEGWNMGQLPDKVVRSVFVGAEDTDSATLMAKDPRDSNGGGFKIGVMVQRNGQWRVPASLLLGDDFLDGAKFVTPAKEVIDQATTMADAITGGAERVLVRLKAGEFKEATEVQSAIEAEMQKAPG